MKIGIDLDGVLFDSDHIFEAYAELFDIDNNGKGKQNESRFMEVAYGWSDEQFDEFLSKYLSLILTDSPVMILAKEILNRLRQDGHELVVITNRSTLGGIEQTITEKRFEEENLTFDKIVFIKGSKLSACQAEGIDVMIDNTPNIIEDLAKNNIKGIYFRDNTREITNPLVKTARNWPEVYRIIKNL